MDGKSLDRSADGRLGGWLTTDFCGKRRLNLEAVGGLLRSCPVKDDIVADAHGREVVDQTRKAQRRRTGRTGAGTA
jgi:hypothetical protein